MAPLGSTAIFYAVLVAPGFVAVMTAISLAGIEGDHSQFVLLVWSLVTSLIIDTVFLGIYQLIIDPITSTGEISDILLSPYLRVDIIMMILVGSVLLGILAAIGLIVELPTKARRLLQSKSALSYTPRQPWENFMRESRMIHVKTSDDQLYAGDVMEWSRAEKPREVRLSNPEWYNPDKEEFESVGREDLLLLDDDIDRLVMHSWDDGPVQENDGFLDGFLSTSLACMGRRGTTGAIILFLAGWYGFQLIVADRIGVEDARKWFYFTPQIGTGWIFAPISHDMTDPGHLIRNTTNLLLAGSFIEPHLEEQDYLKSFFVISAFSILVPVIGSAIFVDGYWLVAGASGGVYGLWVFAASYRFEVVRNWREWSDMDEWSDLRYWIECLMILSGLALLIAVPLIDVLTGGTENAISHVSGMLFGLVLALEIRTEWLRSKFK